MTQTRINIRTVVNASQIRREKRDGRDVIVVPSATLPDNVVMNGVRYPAEEIEKAYKGLEGTIAPLGHPTVNGSFVSASDPRGLARGYIGAHNENVRREGGRVLLDKVIDVEVANRSEDGKRVLAAIDKGGPIHTSTGLYALMTPAINDAKAARIASGIVFDHDAILIDEPGAATPEQGVGMLVNAKDRDGHDVEVVNSSLTEEADREVDWAVDSLVRAVVRKRQVPLLETFKSSILGLIRGEAITPATQLENEEMAVTDEQFKNLTDQVAALANSVAAISTAIPEAVANAIAPLKTQTEALANAAKANDEAELAALRGAIVNSNLMDEATAGELTLNAARALAPAATPRHAYGLNSAFGGAAPAKVGFDLPE